MIKHGTAPYLECSGAGEPRLSAFNARVNGRTIEEQYQAAKRFEDGSTGLHWRKAKGKRAVNQSECLALYSRLWDEYIAAHADLLIMICDATGLSDMYGQQGHACQATELWRIRNSYLSRGPAQTAIAFPDSTPR
jgi:hypothetical protein